MTNTRTIYLDNPTDEWKRSIAEFFDGTNAPVTLVDSPDGADIIVDWPEERQVCEPARLHSGGRIACANAFKVAGRLRMDRTDVGRLINHLEIRIISCQLGCFP